MHYRSILILSLFCILSLPVKAEEIVRVAVASNFSAPIKEIVLAYSRTSDDKIKVSFGSSGKIFAQIRYGAPFDIFLSADDHKTVELEKLELTIEGSMYTYAEGKLILWSRDSSFIDSKGLVLTHGDFSRLALANPKLAPYGKAAQETLESLGTFKQLKPKLVKGENISQTFQFIDSGNAKLGFIALSQLLTIDKNALNSELAKTANLGSLWLIPENLYQPIRQDAVLLKRSVKNEAAFRFYEYLKGAEAKKIIQSYGYNVLN